jgi:hypothetical protein
LTTGLAGAGTADQADFLARADGQGQAVDDAALAAVTEAHILKSDLAARHLEGGRIGPVGERDRPGDGHHAFLDHADVLEDRCDLPAHPAGDVDDLPGERQRHRHGPDLDLALRPQHQRERAGGRHHRRVERGQAEAEQRVEPQRAIEQLGVVIDGVAHIGVLLARAGEQLHRKNVGVAVDDAPGQQRAPFRHVLGSVAHARHEHPQHEQIAEEPQRDRQRQHGVGGGEQNERARAVDEDVPDAGE